MLVETIKLKEDEYFNIDIENNVDIYFINGGRGVGKSYFVKQYVADQIKKGKKFMYVRGKNNELATSISWLEETNIQNTFGFDGQFIRGKPYAGALSFSPFKKDEVATMEHIGYTISLESSALIKSGNYEDVTTIVFEEYARVNQKYKDELQQTINFFELIETVARDRKIKIFCLANNIRTVSPLEEMFQNANNVKKIKVFKKTPKNGVLAGIQQQYIDYLQGEQLDDSYINLKEYDAIYNLKIKDKTIVVYKHRYLNNMIAFNIEQPKKNINDKLELLNNTFKLEDKPLFFSNYQSELFIRKNFKEVIQVIKKELY